MLTFTCQITKPMVKQKKLYKDWSHSSVSGFFSTDQKEPLTVFAYWADNIPGQVTGLWAKLILLMMSLLTAGVLDWVTFKVPTNPKALYDSEVYKPHGSLFFPSPFADHPGISKKIERMRANINEVLCVFSLYGFKRKILNTFSYFLTSGHSGWQNVYTWIWTYF